MLHTQSFGAFEGKPYFLGVILCIYRHEVGVNL